MHMKKPHYSIGEISRLCNVSRKALRLYDSMGLLSSRRNDENNYRTYSHNDLLMVLVLKYYKQMGFRLEEMKSFLVGNGSDEGYMRESFEHKIDELAMAQAKLRHCEQCVRDWHSLLAEAHLVRESSVSEVSVKYAEPRRLLFQDQGFEGDIKSAIINLSFMDYAERSGDAVTGPVCIQYASLSARISGESQPIRVMQDFLRPGGTGDKEVFGGSMVATCYHMGPLEGIPSSYRRILEWIDRHGYAAGAGCCERYVSDYWTSSDPRWHVAELMVEVSRKACP
ncbi:MAG: MerR family transcriptional regulator [Mailhella sp.]|nr:MerR family transcriptional regulator [Mailhella sp.]